MKKLLRNIIIYIMVIVLFSSCLPVFAFFDVDVADFDINSDEEIYSVEYQLIQPVIALPAIPVGVKKLLGWIAAAHKGYSTAYHANTFYAAMTILAIDQMTSSYHLDFPSLERDIESWIYTRSEDQLRDLLFLYEHALSGGGSLTLNQADLQRIGIEDLSIFARNNVTLTTAHLPVSNSNEQGLRNILSSYGFSENMINITVGNVRQHIMDPARATPRYILVVDWGSAFVGGTLNAVVQPRRTIYITTFSTIRHGTLPFVRGNGFTFGGTVAEFPRAYGSSFFSDGAFASMTYSTTVTIRVGHHGLSLTPTQANAVNNTRFPLLDYRFYRFDIDSVMDNTVPFPRAVGIPTTNAPVGIHIPDIRADFNMEAGNIFPAGIWDIFPLVNVPSIPWPWAPPVNPTLPGDVDYQLGFLSSLISTLTSRVDVLETALTVADITLSGLSLLPNIVGDMSRTIDNLLSQVDFLTISVDRIFQLEKRFDVLTQTVDSLLGLPQQVDFLTREAQRLAALPVQVDYLTRAADRMLADIELLKRAHGITDSQVRELGMVVTGLGARVGHIEDSLHGINTKLGELEGSKTVIGTRVGYLEGAVTGLGVRVGELDNAITGIQSRIDAMQASVAYTGTSILTAIAALPAAIIGDPSNLDFSPLSIGVTDRFPFSIPFDLLRFFSTFNVSSEVPHFSISFAGTFMAGFGSFDIDFHRFNSLAQIIRFFSFMGFTLGLIMVTRTLIRG